MQARVFHSHPLPEAVARTMRARLVRAHADDPFSPLDPRRSVRRVMDSIADLAVTATVYRGGVEVRGTEVDHVWLELSTSHLSATYVVDLAFPLFAEAFVDTLRRFVAGDADADELAGSAARAGVEERVLGVFPRTVRYLGAPVWAAR